MDLINWIKNKIKSIKYLHFDSGGVIPPGVFLKDDFVKTVFVKIEHPYRSNYSSPYKRRANLKKVINRTYLGENFYKETIEWVEERK